MNTLNVIQCPHNQYIDYIYLKVTQTHTQRNKQTNKYIPYINKIVFCVNEYV